MSQQNSLKGCLYDLAGLIVFLAIIFITVMSCSSTARNAVTNFYNQHYTESNDTIKKDSVVVVKKDTIRIKEVDKTVRDTVPLTKGDDGLFYISTKVNGIPMKFALDTGCSDVYISVVEYLFLERQGLITDKTHIPSSSIIANGDTIEEFTIKLDKITIGNKTIKNVNCAVSNNSKSALLLGQGVLSQMGDIRIKYNEKMLIIE